LLFVPSSVSLLLGWKVLSRIRFLYHTSAAALAAAAAAAAAAAVYVSYAINVTGAVNIIGR